MRTLLLVLSLLLPSAAGAADANKPHDHQGVLTPYTGTPPTIELSDKDLERLARGKSVMVPIQEAEGAGRGLAIQDIAANPRVVWSRIVSYDRYPDWVNYVSECETYEQSGDRIKVRFVLKGFGFHFEYFIDHVYRPDQGYMTWTLDYSKLSDFDDSVGYWFVEDHPTNKGWTRLYYSVELRVKGNVPGFIQEIATKRGLVEATQWVKREAEAVAGD